MRFYRHENYFNLEYPTDDAKTNELLEYLKNSDPFYQTKNFPRIVERVKYFKVQKEGVTIMCEIADRIRQEGKETNTAILSKWLKCASKASSFAEFEAKM